VAVVLLSGGLDSSTVLAHAVSKGFTPYALSFSYGQRHEFELAAAGKLATLYGVPRHEVVDLDLRAFGGSALTSDIPVPKHQAVEELDRSTIPVTYVPARNIIFLSIALGFAEAIGSRDIFIGVNAVDYSGYPDCRSEFIDAFVHMANVGTAAGVGGQSFTIHTPLLELSKAEIIRLGTALGVDYGLTSSCYDPNEAGLPCGACDSCLLRRRGFEEAGLQDPLKYTIRSSVDSQ
jgi:7-cyano-7-deazaguanine synthase